MDWAERVRMFVAANIQDHPMGWMVIAIVMVIAAICFTIDRLTDREFAAQERGLDE
jgi:hypothetical protein